MTAQDFAPESRLVAAKQVLEEFVTSSPGFELGLIQVAAFPKLMVPVTAERASVLKALQTVNSAGFGEDGTAIGSGIASAANRLRGAAWNRRRILLLTDGVNNRGSISPVDAARLAAGMGIRIDAVGLGTDRVSRYWVPASEQSSVEVEARIEIDDKALAEVAGITGGAYRKVADSAELRRVLLDLASELRQPSEPPGAERRVSLPQALSACALLLLCVEFAWRRFLFSELPG
jgi:Ca-activated chloride channel family protein